MSPSIAGLLRGTYSTLEVHVDNGIHGYHISMMREFGILLYTGASCNS